MGNSVCTYLAPRPADPSQDKRRPPDSDMVNESVWEFYSASRIPDVEVVFLHGLQKDENYTEAFWRTWLSRDRSVVWPKHWLGDYLRDKNQIQARILSISYDSYVRCHDGEMDLYSIVGNLRRNLINDAGVGQSCPVVLVGHSLGGIVIKELLLRCSTVVDEMNPTTPEAKEINNFTRNCKGVFYYSTPHAGSDVMDNIADFLRHVPITLLNAPLIKLLKTLSAETARINNSFANLRKNLGIRSEAIGESLPSKAMGFSAKVVKEASSRFDIDGNGYYTALAADHFDVCKPKNTTDAIFKNLVQLISSVVEERRSNTH